MIVSQQCILGHGNLVVNARVLQYEKAVLQLCHVVLTFVVLRQ